MADRAWHWIKANEACRMPRRHIILDTESRTERTRTGHVQSWRLGAAAFRAQEKGRRLQRTVSTFDRPDDLWSAVADWTTPRSRTVLWAHNLGYDVRIAEALTALPAMGFNLEAYNLTPRGTWLAWRRGQAALLMADTGSVWPTTLEEVGGMFGMRKPGLPADDAPRSAWEARCVGDVEITERAVVSYLDWLESEGMGNWQITGAGQSWAAFRHRWLTHRMLVHGDQDALAAERRAMWTGRTEAYWRGRDARGPFHEWDLEAAYARCARDVSVPVRLIGEMPPAYRWRNVLDRDDVAVLLDCTVTTEVPVVPTSHGGRIVWPVGTFRTVLWSPEVALLLEVGGTVTVHRGWMYRCAPALRAWGDWILESLHAPDAQVPAWQKKIIKHWSRALIGRFAMTYTSWQALAHLAAPAMWRADVIDDSEPEPYEMMALGAQVFRSTGVTEWDQSMPQVTGFVMSVCRVRLWRILSSLPEDCPLYVDTDSLLTHGRWHDEVAAVAAGPHGHGLRLKRSWRTAEIRGPRQLVMEGAARMAGVPRRAQRTGPDTWAGQVWETAAAAVAARRPHQVVTTDREWTVKGVDHRRAPAGGGWTAPLQVREGVNA